MQCLQLIEWEYIKKQHGAAAATLHLSGSHLQKYCLLRYLIQSKKSKITLFSRYSI